jgi:hypothetical protein
MKLSTWPKESGLSYKTAWRLWKTGWKNKTKRVSQATEK